MGRGSEILHVYTSCITLMLFQMPSRNSGFVCDLFLSYCNLILANMYIYIYIYIYIFKKDQSVVVYCNWLVTASLDFRPSSYTQK